MFSTTATAEDPGRLPWFRFFLLQQPFGLDVPEFWNILSGRGSLGAFERCDFRISPGKPQSNHEMKDTVIPFIPV